MSVCVGVCEWVCAVSTLLCTRIRGNRIPSFLCVVYFPSFLPSRRGASASGRGILAKKRSSRILINGATGEGVVVRKKKTLRVESPDELEGDIDWGERQQKVNRECQRVLVRFN